MKKRRRHWPAMTRRDAPECDSSPDTRGARAEAPGQTGEKKPRRKARCRGGNLREIAGFRNIPADGGRRWTAARARAAEPVRSGTAAPSARTGAQPAQAAGAGNAKPGQHGAGARSGARSTECGVLPRREGASRGVEPYEREDPPLPGSGLRHPGTAPSGSRGRPPEPVRACASRWRPALVGFNRCPVCGGANWGCVDRGLLRQGFGMPEARGAVRGVSALDRPAGSGTLERPHQLSAGSVCVSMRRDSGCEPRPSVGGMAGARLLSRSTVQPSWGPSRCAWCFRSARRRVRARRSWRREARGPGRRARRRRPRSATTVRPRSASTVARGSSRSWSDGLEPVGVAAGGALDDAACRT